MEENLSNLGNFIADFNELIKTEIHQIKNSVNSNISDLQSSINNSFTNFNTSINNLNDVLLQLSTQILKICETVEDIITTPIDNND